MFITIYIVCFSSAVSRPEFYAHHLLDISFKYFDTKPHASKLLFIWFAIVYNSIIAIYHHTYCHNYITSALIMMVITCNC